MTRWILHVDMDEFLAAVDRLGNPAPVVQSGQEK